MCYNRYQITCQIVKILLRILSFLRKLNVVSHLNEKECDANLPSLQKKCTIILVDFNHGFFLSFYINNICSNMCWRRRIKIQISVKNQQSTDIKYHKNLLPPQLDRVFNIQFPRLSSPILFESFVFSQCVSQHV